MSPVKPFKLVLLELAIEHATTASRIEEEVRSFAVYAKPRAFYHAQQAARAHRELSDTLRQTAEQWR